MTSDERAYYTSHSAVSDPGEMARLLDAMPADPERLVAAVSGVVLHRLFLTPLGLTVPAHAQDDLDSRLLRTILERIVARDSAALDSPRPPERRFIGICRDYALMACAVLRHHAIPARVRVGFATYFQPGLYDDHWVCEYHLDGQWRLLDAELSERVRRHFAIAFPSSDVPRDRFLVAGDVWRRIRRDALDPDVCGVGSERLTGAWFVGAAVVRDLACLNKREMLGWDYWGTALDFSGPGSQVSDAAAAQLDAVAAVIGAGEPDWKVLRELYEGSEALRVPSVVRSFGPAGPKEVPVSV